MKEEKVQEVLAQAYKDWSANTGEHDQSVKSGLTAIFKDSGWANNVTHTAAGKVRDWCGMAVDAWLFRAGMNPFHRKSFYHCMNVEDFATYGSPKGRKYPFNKKRLMTEVLIDNNWIKIKDWHKQEKNLRKWIDEKTIRSTPLDKLDIRPGDVVLIDYQGPMDKEDDELLDEADHITMCASYNIMGKGILETIEGNASGKGPKDEKRTDSVIVNTRDLNNKDVLKRIFGILRLSDLDFDLTHQLR